MANNLLLTDLSWGVKRRRFTQPIFHLGYPTSSLRVVPAVRGVLTSHIPSSVAAKHPRFALCLCCCEASSPRAFTRLCEASSPRTFTSAARRPRLTLSSAAKRPRLAYSLRLRNASSLRVVIPSPSDAVRTNNRFQSSPSHSHNSTRYYKDNPLHSSPILP